MQLFLTVFHLLLALGLIGLILIQHGKGADAGAAFGSGASATVFGAQGSGSFLTRTTAIMATLFFLTSMALAYFAAQVGEPEGLMDGIELGGDAPVAVPAEASDTAPVALEVGDLPEGAVVRQEVAETVGDLPPVVDGPPTVEEDAAEALPAGDDLPAVPSVPSD